MGAGDDAGRVAAVRAAVGQDLALRLDANGAWNVEEAVKAIEVLEPAGLELVEEPVHGVDELREVRGRVPVRVAMDETAGEHGALASGAADAVCLKIARCGGTERRSVVVATSRCPARAEGSTLQRVPAAANTWCQPVPVWRNPNSVQFAGPQCRRH